MIINATSPRTSDAYHVQNPIFSVQAYGNTTSGSGAAQFKVWGSNSTSASVPWIPVCTIDSSNKFNVGDDIRKYKKP